jgi:hypothetical protein
MTWTVPSVVARALGMTTYEPACGAGSFLANPPFQRMTEPEIPNRDEQHGGIEATGLVSQAMKFTMSRGRNWQLLTPGEREALDMIAHKISRILSGGDPHDPEHWRDIAGYAIAARRADAEGA